MNGSSHRLSCLRVRLLHNVTSVARFILTDHERRTTYSFAARAFTPHKPAPSAGVCCRVRGKVKLVYIDPPFNTGQAFTHYDDGLEHSVWLTMLRTVWFRSSAFE